MIRLGPATLQGRMALLSLLVALMVTAGCVIGLSWVGTSILGQERARRALAVGEAIDGQLRNLADRGEDLLGALLVAGQPPDGDRFFSHLAIGRHGRVERLLIDGGLDGRLLVSLLLGGRDWTGFAVLGGEPAMVFTRRLTEEGPARGRQAVAVLPLSQPDARILQTVGWGVKVRSLSREDRGGLLDRQILPRPQLLPGDAGRLVQVRYPAHGGEILFELAAPDPHGAERALIEAVVVTGLIVAMAALLIGMLLGSHWVAPIHRLAQRLAQGGERPVPLAEEGHIEEAAMLARAFTRLLERLEQGREALRSRLRHQERATLLHRRFVRRIMSELYQPLQVLIRTFDDLHEDPDRLHGERLIRSRRAARDLGERLALLRGLDVDLPEDSGLATFRMRLEVFCGQVCDMMQELARNAGTRLRWQADEHLLAFDSNLATHVLVSLLANALRAPEVGEVVLQAEAAAGQVCFRVCDDGQGFQGDMAERLRAACARGSVLPDEPGFGLGLPLALSQAQAIGGRVHLERNGPGGTVLLFAVPYRSEPKA